MNLMNTEEGFVPAWRESDEFAFVRPSALPGLFEQIVISSAGRSGEAVGCDVAISLVRSKLGTKGMCELDLLAELATDPERGWTIIENAEQAQEFERRVGEIAPSAARVLAQRKGPALLTRTAAARAAVDGHLKQLPDVTDLAALKTWLLTGLDSDGAALARRLAAGPGVLQKAGADLVYEVACLAIVRFEVGNQGVSEAKLDPLGDRELMWRIQLLVDRLEARKKSAGQRTAEAEVR
jgi:hypothetical protein